MIVSHSQRFLFLKPRKTAGTTVEVALSPLLGPGDRATLIEPEEESLRQVNPGVIVGQIRYRHHLLPRRLRDHSTLSSAVACFGPGILDYRLISMSRNPWDRAVSQFFWSMRHGDLREQDFDQQRAAFRAYTLKWAPRTWLDPLYGRKRQRTASAAGMYSLGRRVMADYFIRFECLAQDLHDLGGFLGMPPIALPEKRFKSTQRKASRPWQDFFDADTRDLIARECATEIALLGYGFDDPMPKGGPLHQRD